KEAQRSGFVVPGTGRKALEGAFNVLVRGAEAPAEITAEQPLTLVFFSAPFGAYVQLDDVQIDCNIIRVIYRFQPHATLNLSSHFALIPLGDLKPGTYQVEIVKGKAKDAQSEVADERAENIVCNSFEFIV